MKKTLALILILALSLAALTGCGSKKETPADTNTDNSAQTEAPATLSGSVSTNGSTSMEKVIGALSEQFMADNSGVTITYDPTGSGAGIEAASNGSADIGLASRALKDEEKAGGLTETIVALDGIAVIVNADSKVEDLTVEQIAKIFTGEITDWSEVGGDAGTISCIGREAGNVSNMPGLFTPVRFLTTGIISGMAYASVGSLYQQALYSIGLVLFLFIMLINVFLNVCVKNRKEG